MSNKPSLYAYAVKDRGRNQKAIFTRIGAAWPHEKGKGLTIDFEAFPASGSGRVVLLEPKDETGKPADAPADTFEAEAAKETA